MAVRQKPTHKDAALASKAMTAPSTLSSKEIKTLGGIVLDLEKNAPQQHKAPNPKSKAAPKKKTT